MSELQREQEFAAERFASALESAERGHALDQRDLEDPALAPIVNAAGLLRRTWNAITPDPDYFARSRSTILAAMKRPEPEEAPLNFLERLWRLPVLTPIASAAAAAVITLIFALSVLGGGGDAVVSTAVVPAPAPVNDAVEPAVVTAIRIPLPNPTDELPVTVAPAPDPIAEALDQFVGAISQVVALADRGEEIPATLLRTITGSAALVATEIETRPDSVDRLSVLEYLLSSAEGREVLGTVSVPREDVSALATAQEATQDGVVVASRFIAAWTAP